jgi:hypothetical protein
VGSTKIKPPFLLKDVSETNLKYIKIRLPMGRVNRVLLFFISFGPRASLFESSSNLFDKSEENKNNVSFVDKIED